MRRDRPTDSRGTDGLGNTDAQQRRNETPMDLDAYLTDALPIPAELLPSLARWLDNGGAVPLADVSATCDLLNPEQYEEQHERELAAAIRCAIANDDMSGLRYLLGEIE